MVVYCPRCWAEVKEGASTCHVCGAPLAADEDFVAKLIAALHHREPTRAALAIEILADHLREPRGYEPILALLTPERDAYVVLTAVRALARWGDRRAVEPLAHLLLNPAAPLVVRKAVVEALAQLGGDAAQAALQAALADPNAVVVATARAQLTRFTSKEGGSS
jgi:HEAT repeat protein